MKSLCSRVPEVRLRPSETTVTTSVVRRGSVSTRATLTGVTDVQEAGIPVAAGVVPGVAGLAVSLLAVAGDADPGLAVPPEGAAEGEAVSVTVADGSPSAVADDGSGFGTPPTSGAQAVSAKALNATTRMETRRTRRMVAA